MKDKLIQDIRPYDARQALRDAVEEEKAREAWELGRFDNQMLITELYSRGVSIKDIFGRYYEFEAAGDGRTMDIEDAELAGVIVNQDRSI